tara:strand:+ start:13952 stop:14458 length:507 start_codon:yes stop_codon:yes gene_type:complete
MKHINLTNKKSTIWEGEKEIRCGSAAELGYIPHNEQVGMINILFNEQDFEHKSLLLKELEGKRNNYKQQDKKKGFTQDNGALISQEELVMKLVASKLTCFYCKKQVRIFYSKIRDPEQWTLDRKDNDLPHTDDNTCIACLKCNLDRRTTNMDKFNFTKNLTITRKDYN